MPRTPQEKTIDTRMGWIRNLDRLNDPNHWTEHEIASEGPITGLFTWSDKSGEGLILCAPLDPPDSPDEMGLYYYLLKIKTANCDPTDLDAATPKGYVFPGGIPAELLSLFSLFFRRRFYLTANYHGKLTHQSMRIREKVRILRTPCPSSSHPAVFSKEQQAWDAQIYPFLRSIINLEEKHHPRFALAAYNYARALAEIGVDSEMVFVRLVSAIESLSGDVQLDEKDDPLEQLDIDSLPLTNPQKGELRQLLQTRRVKARFRVFIEEHSKESVRDFQGDSLTKINVKNLKHRINAIYDARSAYLHSGQPMYLSKMQYPFSDWDMDPSVGRQVGRKLYTEKQKLPYIPWFEGVVRTSLLTFLKKHQKPAP